MILSHTNYFNKFVWSSKSSQIWLMLKWIMNVVEFEWYKL